MGAWRGWGKPGSGHAGGGQTLLSNVDVAQAAGWGAASHSRERLCSVCIRGGAPSTLKRSYEGAPQAGVG